MRLFLIRFTIGVAFGGIVVAALSHNWSACFFAVGLLASNIARLTEVPRSR